MGAFDLPTTERSCECGCEWFGSPECPNCERDQHILKQTERLLEVLNNFPMDQETGDYQLKRKGYIYINDGVVTPTNRLVLFGEEENMKKEIYRELGGRIGNPLSPNLDEEN